MAQVILLLENEVLNELISVNLVSFLSVDLIKRKNAEAVTSLLEILPEIDLIICQYEAGIEKSAQLIQKYIIDHHLNINIIALGAPKSIDNDFTVSIEKPNEWEKVIEVSAKMLGITADIFASKAAPDFVPISVSYFNNLNTVNCDVFIRIKKTAAEYQFVKRIHTGDNFSREVINRYRDQGLTNFYIPQDQQKIFTTYLSNVLVEKLENTSLEINKRLELMGESFEIATAEVLKMGFTSEVVQLTDSIIHSLIKNAEQSPEMTNLLFKVINANSPLAFQRCHMTSVVAGECLKNLKLNSPENILVITVASFFHDIYLIDHLDLAKLNSTLDMLEANLPAEKKDLVMNHALEASRLVSKYPNIPLGVEQIIKEHHGIPHGIGFSLDIESMATLSKVFIISHDFVLELIKYKENKTTPRSLSEFLYKKFPGTTCTKIIKALELSLVKKKK